MMILEHACKGSFAIPGFPLSDKGEGERGQPFEAPRQRQKSQWLIIHKRYSRGRRAVGGGVAIPRIENPPTS